MALPQQVHICDRKLCCPLMGLLLIHALAPVREQGRGGGDKRPLR